MADNFAVNYEEKRKIVRLPKIVAIMSMPRLAFSDNLFTALTILLDMNIPLKKVTGAFWHHGLENGIGDILKEEPEFILTLDYDSWFKREHILALYAILRDNSDIDAVCPLQVKRDSNACMANFTEKIEASKNNDKSINVPVESIINRKFIPIESGHFGLTLIRASVFEKMKREPNRKSWFWDRPDKNGEWRKDYIDADIGFWHSFNEAGCKLVLAPNIRIAHLQLAARWPGIEASGYKPIWIFLSDMENDNLPDGCIPNLKDYGF